MTFLEGPRWHANGVWVSDFFSRRVLRLSREAKLETVCRLGPPTMPSGLGWTSEGDLLVSSMVDRTLLRVRNGQLELHADLSAHASWHINDILVDPADGVYVGNFGWDEGTDPHVRPTSLHRVDSHGRVLTAAEDLVFPNGMALTDDARTLLVAETFAGRITAFDRAADGRLDHRRVWAQFASPFCTTTEAVASRAPLPDGIALDADGALWIGDAAGTGALRVGEGGRILDRVDVGGGQTAYAVVLGGVDRRTLYLCAAAPYGTADFERRRDARLLATRVDVPGEGTP